MINSVNLSGDWAKRLGSKKKVELSFESGVNVLCGPNGSGKSSILEAIMLYSGLYSRYRSDLEMYKNEKNDRVKSSVRTLRECGVELKIDGPGRVNFLDFEDRNPRTMSHFVNGLEMFQIMSKFKSHGQVVRVMLNAFSEEGVKDTALLIDEPDQALDLDGIETLRSALEKSPAQQILVSVHHPAIVLGEFHVIELVSGYKDKIRESVASIYRRSDVGSWQPNVER